METLITQGISVQQFTETISSLFDKKLEAFADKYIPDRLIKAKEAQQILGVCFNTLKNYVEDGVINQVVTGGNPLYSYRELIKYKELCKH